MYKYEVCVCKNTYVLKVCACKRVRAERTRREKRGTGPKHDREVCRGRRVADQFQF